MSGPVDLGQTYRYRYPVTDSAGAPADAGSVTVAVTLPDGTTVVPTVVHSGVGLYDIAYTTVVAGGHHLRGTATGGIFGTEADVFEDAFVVEAPLRMFVGLDEAFAHLRAGAIIVTTVDREQLRWLCLAACDAVERALGRAIARRSITAEAYDGGDCALLLRSTPVVSVATVVESGVTLTAGDYVLDTMAGILHRGTMTVPRVWLWGRQNVFVTYLVGYLDPPWIARKVALDAVAAMWRSSQQAPHPAIDAAFAVRGAVAGMAEIEQRAFWSLASPGVA